MRPAAFGSVYETYIAQPLVGYNKKKTNSAVLVHEQTIPPEQPPLVGEVSANFCG
jgi:hypothetical protein